MASKNIASRLHRLNQLVEQDLAVLPDMPPSSISSDDEPAGGISLNAVDAIDEDLQKVNLAKDSPEQYHAVDPDLKAEVDSQPTAPDAPASTCGTANGNDEKRFVWLEGAPSAYNLGSAPKASVLPTTKLSPTNLRQGELERANIYYTPILALSKYPYKFCNPNNQQDIASAFFDEGKFWRREWELYYVWDIDGAAVKPLVLVPEHQVNQLLNEINSTLSLHLKITNGQREDGLLSSFPDHPRCTPRYLGRSNSREDYDNMVVSAPGEPQVEAPAGRTLEMFKKTMENMWAVQANKTKANKEKKRAHQALKQASMTEQFKRAQRYVGLRALTPIDFATIDVSCPAPHVFDKDVVFVCVDVEAYERAHNKITEVGLASLDTRDLKGVPPGKDGENWRSKVKARHLRIREHKHLINGEFVNGCPDRFEFGQSEVVSLKDAPAVVASCFKAPFCEPPDESGVPTKIENMGPGKQRNVVLLGHDTESDVRYLQNLGWDPLHHVIEMHDTATMYRVWRREPQITNLGKILYDFDIAGWNLHNAGNDAAYTVQAMLGICVREGTLRGTAELKASRNDQKASRLATLTEEANKKMQEDMAGWTDEETI